MTEDEAKTKWCSITGYVGIYEVSDDGRVRSLDRWKPYRNDVRFAAGMVISPTAVNGYPRVLLWKDGKSKNAFVHRLVAEAFIGPAPTAGHQVNHKNGDRADPRAANLEWVTASENQLHSYRELGRTVSEATRAAAPKGEDNGRAKLTERGVAQAREAIKAGAPLRAAADALGVHPATLGRALSGENWKCLAGRPD